MGALPQARQGGKRVVGLILDGWGLEHSFGLARIGIEAEDQELGRERAEIDRAVDERLRRIVIGDARNFSADSGCSFASAAAKK